MLKYVCKICGKEFKHHSLLVNHLHEVHHLTSQGYYDGYCKSSENEGKCKQCGKPTEYRNFTIGYREFCSKPCSNTYRRLHAIEGKSTCKICNAQFTTKTQEAANGMLVKHIKQAHNIETSDYYDMFFKQEGEGVCPNCGKPTAFLGLTVGYNTYCSQSCNLELTKTNPNKHVVILQKEKEKQNILAAIIKKIKDKYTNFINGGEKKAKFSDIRSDVIEQKTVSEEKSYIDPENNKEYTVKTEISTTSTYNWLGSQEYKPKYESCNAYNKRYYDEIDDNQSFSSNEWC